MILLRAVIVLIVMIWTSAALAQPPATRPSGEVPSRPGPSRRFMSDEDRQRAIEFARLNMPNLYTMLEETPRHDPRRRRLLSFAFRRYRMAETMPRDSEMYDAMLARVKNEDELFGLVQQLEQAPEEEKPAIRAELLSKVELMVLGWIDERAQRIESLKRQLESEQQQLQRDREDIPRLADRYMKMLVGERDPRMTPGEDEPPPGFGPATDPSDRPRRPQHR